MMEAAHVAVLLEKIQGEFRVFGEALQTTNDNVRALSDNVDRRMNVLEHKVDGLASDLADVKGTLTGVEVRLTRVERAVNGRPARKRKT